MKYQKIYDSDIYLASDNINGSAKCFLLRLLFKKKTSEF